MSVSSAEQQRADEFFSLLTRRTVNPEFVTRVMASNPLAAASDAFFRRQLVAFRNNIEQAKLEAEVERSYSGREQYETLENIDGYIRKHRRQDSGQMKS